MINMKKTVLVICLILCAGIISSCGSKPSEISGDKPSAANEVSNGFEVLTVKQLGYDAGEIIRDYDITDSITYTEVETKIGERKEIVFHGKTYQLEYLNTTICEIGDVEHDNYTVIGEAQGNNTCSLYGDGSLRRLSVSSAAKLEISKTASGDEIAKALTDEFSSEFDFGYYKERKYEFAQTAEEISRTGDFVSCTVTFFNSSGDHTVCNTMRFQVQSDGNVCGISDSKAAKITSLLDTLPQINKDDVDSEICKKLNTEYGKDMEYTIHSSGLTTYRGSPCITLFLFVRPSDGGNANFDSEMTELLVLLK